MENVKFTPLKEEHERLGAKMVDFAGWYMPVQYEGLKEEHLNVRSKVGLFDVSHMGEIRIRGEKALESLQWLTSNDVSTLKVGEAQYSLLTNEHGGIVDDLIVYCFEEGTNYLLCVNASNIEKDYQWILDHNLDAEVINESDSWAQIAVQGPNSVELVSRVLKDDISDVTYFKFKEFTYGSVSCILARTGYTGEDGFEIFLRPQVARNFWVELLESGGDLGVMPVGLGARDTLRTEMKYSLYGHEITDETNPYEAGLGWVVKPKAKDFVGKAVILEQKEKGLDKKLIGFKMLERGIARQGYKLFSTDEVEAGYVTSGTPSPSLQENIGIAYINKDCATPGTEFFVEIRTRKTKAVVVKTPFVNPKGD